MKLAFILISAIQDVEKRILKLQEVCGGSKIKVTILSYSFISNKYAVVAEGEDGDIQIFKKFLDQLGTVIVQ